ncbi:MAG TPA: hypothetical protein DIT67_00595 [Octadecabacter sp.]|nr:hypothetical protein [Octadecabacter sp.]
MKGRTGHNINNNGILLLNLANGKQGWCHKETIFMNNQKGQVAQINLPALAGGQDNYCLLELVNELELTDALVCAIQAAEAEGRDVEHFNWREVHASVPSNMGGV